MHLILLAGLVTLSSAQFYNPTANLISGSVLPNNPPPVDPRSLVHQEVAQNAAWEATLPPELLNSQYKNPAIATALAKESWLANKEFPVFHRDTQDIPREAIVKIIKSAGFHNRRRRHAVYGF